MGVNYNSTTVETEKLLRSVSFKYHMVGGSDMCMASTHSVRRKYEERLTASWSHTDTLSNILPALCSYDL